MKFIAKLLLLTIFTITYVHGACKAGEGDPYGPHPSPPGPRVYSYAPSDPSKDTSPKSGSVLNILSYNIQSGLSLTCKYDLAAQAAFMNGQHFFGLQEVDMFNDLRCNCSQPSFVANATGHNVLFLNTILYRTGYYGSALSSAYPVLESRYHMYSLYSVEERGVLAVRTTPPQLGGKTLWVLNTHLQYDSEYIRLGQTAELVNFTESIRKEFPDAYFIVMGDYYVVPGLGSYAQLEAYFLNAWTVFHGSSDDGYTYPADFPSNRFDHVWYKFPAGVKYSVTVENIDSKLSDHKPLQVYFDFGATGSPSATSAGDTNAAATTSANAASIAAATSSANSGATSATAAATSANAVATSANSAATAANAAATSAAATNNAATTADAAGVIASVTSANSASATSGNAAAAAATSAAATASNAASTASNAATSAANVASTVANAASTIGNAVATSASAAATTGVDNNNPSNDGTTGLQDASTTDDTSATSAATSVQFSAIFLLATAALFLL